MFAGSCKGEKGHKISLSCNWENPVMWMQETELTRAYGSLNTLCTDKPSGNGIIGKYGFAG